MDSRYEFEAHEWILKTEDRQAFTKLMHVVFYERLLLAMWLVVGFWWLEAFKSTFKELKTNH